MFKKKILQEYMPEIDVELFDRLVNEARDEANRVQLNDNANADHNALSDAPEGNENDMMGGVM
jgi:ethanolamine utilization microcompartment shell protein EutS